MGFQVDLLTQEREEEYGELLLTSEEALVHHSGEYLQVLQATLRDEAAGLVLREGATMVGALPMLIRKTELGTVMNSLALSGSHGGVLSLKGRKDREKIITILLKEALALARERGWLASTIITSPLVDDREVYREAYGPDYLFERFTQVSDLRRELRLSNKVRGHIKKAKASGVEISQKMSQERLAQFCHLYRGNMEHLGLGVKPLSFFENIAQMMGPKGMAEYSFAFHDGQMIAGLLLLKFKDGITCHETIMDRQYSSLHPVSLLLDEALKRSKAQGYKYFNWGASPSRESGVYKFKKAWGSYELGYSYFTRVHGELGYLKSLPMELVSEHFRWFYLLPYQGLGEGS